MFEFLITETIKIFHNLINFKLPERVRLIPNFAELLHEIKLPSPEKCFLLEVGDEKYIEKWINNGEISCELDQLFEWINYEYKLKKKNLNTEESMLAEEVKKRFPIEQWRVIKVFSDHQKKYRYYKKAVEDVKNRTTPSMNEQTIMTIFSPGWGINT
tara:strand:- start:670 stop:1140 length:471 start_codon:yes stop_codon:yes gene_type:complete